MTIALSPQAQLITSLKRKNMPPIRILITLVVQLLWAAVIAGCVSKPLPPPAPAPESLPIELYFKTVGLPIVSSTEYRLTRDGFLTRIEYEGVLTFKKRTTRRRVTAQAWQAFHEAATRLRLEHWKERYENPNVLDGYYWDLRWISEERKIISGGSNAGPDPKKPSKTLLDEGETASADILLSKALKDLWLQSVPIR